MRFDLAHLPNDIDTLHRIIATQAADVAIEREARAASEVELSAAKAGLVAKALEIEKLKLQIARFRRAQFGRSSERIERTIEQLELMLEELETEVPAPSAATPDLDVEQSSSTKGKRSGRKPLPEHLPRREVMHEPSCTCPACGGEMRKVGEDVTEILERAAWAARFACVRGDLWAQHAFTYATLLWNGQESEASQPTTAM